MSESINTQYQKRWLSPEEVEAEYGFSQSTLSKWRMSSNPNNLVFSKVGRFIRYERVELDKYLRVHSITGVA